MPTAKYKLPETNIRLLRSEDLSKFLEIRNSVSEMLHDDATFTLDECRKWFSTKEPTYYLVESSELGLIGYFRWSLRNDKVVEIGLDLSPEFQGRKWAKSFYAKFIREIIMPTDIKIIALRVLKINHRAQNLYKDLGFRICEETDIDYAMQADVEKVLANSSATHLSDEH